MDYKTLCETETELVLITEELEANGITNISKIQQRHASVILIPQHEHGDDSIVIHSDGPCHKTGSLR